jgi:hypothetical protein
MTSRTRVVEGWFVERCLPRGMYDRLQWLFLEKGEKSAYRLNCPFEPFLQIVSYKLLISEKQQQRRVIDILDSVQRPFCHDVVRVWGRVRYTSPDPEVYFQSDEILVGGPPKKAMIAWYYWPDIRVLQKRYHVSQMDDSFVDFMLVRLCLNQPLLSHYLPWSVVAQALPTEELRERYTLIEELKRVMKRYCKWNVSSKELIQLKFLGQPIRQSTIQDMLQDGTLSISQDEVYSLTPLGMLPLQEDEPVDYPISRGQNWSLGSYMPKERSIDWVRHENTTPNMRLNKQRFSFPGSVQYRILIEFIEKELKATKFLFIFPDFFDPSKAYYDTRVFSTASLPMRNRKNPTEVVFLHGGCDLWKFGQKTPIKTTTEEAYCHYKSFQTGILDDIQFIHPGLFQVVVLFTNSSLPRRFIQWCDRKCGKETTLCLIGSDAQGVYF